MSRINMSHCETLSSLPGRSTWGTRPHSSFRLRCQTPHSSWEQKTESPAGALQRTRSHLQQPVGKEDHNEPSANYLASALRASHVPKWKELNFLSVRIIKPRVILNRIIFFMCWTICINKVKLCPQWNNSECITKQSKGYLMRPTDEVQVMAVQELADHVSPKGEGDSSIILPPALYVFVWIRPQQVTQQTFSTEKWDLVTSKQLNTFSRNYN